jgi:hypothetical protein
MSVVYPKDDFVINWDMTAGLQRAYDMLYGLAFVDNATIVAKGQK